MFGGHFHRLCAGYSLASARGVDSIWTFNSDIAARITNDGQSFWVLSLHANGRKIAAIETLAWDSSWGAGCSLSTWTKFKYAPPWVLHVNLAMFAMPIFIFILVRGWFFDKSWRKRRFRNTVIIIMVPVFLFGAVPIPSGAGDSEILTDEDALRVKLWEAGKEILTRRYGGERNIPALHPRAKNNVHRLKHRSGDHTFFRDAMFYFAPDKMKQGFDEIWPRSARRDDERLGMPVGDEWNKENSTPASTAKLDPPDLEAGKARAREGIEERSGWDDAREIGRVASSLLNEIVGVKEARAWTGDLAGASRIHFFHTDHLGSTRVVTDAVGEVFEKIDYLPFGEIFRDDVVNNGTDFDKHRNKYTGQVFDYTTGLYYYGARYYDPEIGRFTQADTIVPEPLDGQTFNRYTYVNNNPYKFVDPSGHNPVEEFFISLAEAIFVGVCTVVGFMVGGPEGAVAGFMLGSGIVGGIESARKGGEFAEGFVVGVFMSGLTLACPQLAIPGMGYNIYNLIVSNDPDAWANFMGGLVGGYFSPSPVDFGYEPTYGLNHSVDGQAYGEAEAHSYKFVYGEPKVEAKWQKIQDCTYTLPDANGNGGGRIVCEYEYMKLGRSLSAFHKPVEPRCLVIARNRCTIQAMSEMTSIGAWFSGIGLTGTGTILSKAGIKVVGGPMTFATLAFDVIYFMVLFGYADSYCRQPWVESEFYDRKTGQCVGPKEK